MEKTIVFTQEQKSLIWNRFVAPVNGTAEEAQHFVEYCETFGLNPLINDVIFQKYEGKRGAKIKFLTTRDGLLRVASRHSDFVGPPNSNVVREGDEFEFVPSQGDVKHKFGEKRGKILGAYAVLCHKRFRPIAVWVEFQEYFTANAGTEPGRQNTWNSMPSAMIQKVAESWALRRQFPLGGLMTEEEMGNGLSSSLRKEESEIPLFHQQISADNTVVEKQATTDASVAASQINPSTEQKNEQPAAGSVDKLSDSSTEQDTGEQDVYMLDEVNTGVSPAGVPFAKIKVTSQTDGKQVLVLAREKEKVEMARKLPKGKPFTLQTKLESGFVFLKDIILSEAV